MIRRIKSVLIAIALATGGVSGAASAATVNVAGTSSQFGVYDYFTSSNPFTAMFNLAGLSGSLGATLTMSVFDVDLASGEIDNVYMNGHMIGTLTGSDSTTATTTLSVSSSYLVGNAMNVLTAYNVSSPGNWGFQVNSASLAVPVPGPAAGVGLIPLIASGLVGFGLRRRRLQSAASDV